MLIFAGCGNVLMYIDDPDRNYANSYLGVILMCVAVLNTFIEFHQMQRISAMVASFSQLVPAKANVVRDRELKDIPASEIVPGDVVFIKFGDKAPADLVIFHASELKVDNSSLTGESESQDRHPFDYTIQRSR